MSEYQIGKDVQDLQMRLAKLEEQFSQMKSGGCGCDEKPIIIKLQPTVKSQKKKADNSLLEVKTWAIGRDDRGKCELQPRDPCVYIDSDGNFRVDHGMHCHSRWNNCYFAWRTILRADETELFFWDFMEGVGSNSNGSISAEGTNALIKDAFEKANNVIVVQRQCRLS